MNSHQIPVNVKYCVGNGLAEYQPGSAICNNVMDKYCMYKPDLLCKQYNKRFPNRVRLEDHPYFEARHMSNWWMGPNVIGFPFN